MLFLHRESPCAAAVEAAAAAAAAAVRAVSSPSLGIKKGFECF